MKEFESRVGQKGQITLPAEVRARFGIKPKDTVRIIADEDGVRVKPAPSRLLSGFGIATPHNRPEDWAKVREDVEEMIAEDAQTRGQH